MKIAYLILAYDNPLHFKRLIASLSGPSNSIYVHIDKKSNINDFIDTDIKDVYYESLRNNVWWGEFSQVESVIMLLRKATLKKHDYYVLLYGSDYPIRSNGFISSYLKKNRGKEFINLARMPEMDKTLDRIYYYHFLNSSRNNSMSGKVKRLTNQIIRILNLKRALPKKYKNMVLYGGCPWWVLTEEFIIYLLKFIDENPEFLQFWKNVFIPDESFVHTIIGNSPFKNKVKYSLMYTRWIKGSTKPENINEFDLKVINNYQFDKYNGRDEMLYARKFNDSQQKIVDVINNNLLYV